MAKIKDIKFALGLFMLVFGWLLLIVPWFFIIGYSVYLIGAIFIWLSAKPIKTKLLITLIPLIINVSTVMIVGKQFEHYF